MKTPAEDGHTEPACANDHQACQLERAGRILDDLRLLSGDRLEHAFEMGRLLVEWEEGGFDAVAGHATQDAVIASAGLKRATALSNKRLATKFDFEQVRHLGLGKLRLLAANYLEDPMAIIFDGISVHDDAGGVQLLSVEVLSYRELQKVLAGIRAAQRAPAARSIEDENLASAIQAAAAPLLSASIEAATPVPTNEAVPIKEAVVLPATVPASKAKAARRHAIGGTLPVLAAAIQTAALGAIPMPQAAT